MKLESVSRASRRMSCYEEKPLLQYSKKPLLVLFGRQHSQTLSRPPGLSSLSWSLSAFHLSSILNSITVTNCVTALALQLSIHTSPDSLHLQPHHPIPQAHAHHDTIWFCASQGLWRQTVAHKCCHWLDCC